ncbi:MAG: rubrerythrin family protein [Anaerolineae bacterium]|jgi:vacuolar iron transporter family protein|nr:rubrerythrin family protein [Anaerolineae bacterium]
MELSNKVRQQLLAFQENEITEYHIYKRLAEKMQDTENGKILNQIAEDELGHYEDWKKYTGEDVKPNKWAIWKYYIISRVFGFTFGVKLMERGEKSAQVNYDEIREYIPEIDNWIEDENEHENSLLNMLDEERLQYAGSVVLGLNDALVELTGALAGLTLALQNVELIALSGLITGIAASLSMAASEYLATRSEKTDKHPIRAAIYTGIAYIFTVAILITPYLLFDNYFLDLALALTSGVIIIAVFNYYISVAQDESFKDRFLEMAGLSLSVAAFSFGIGYLIRIFLNIEI